MRNGTIDQALAASFVDGGGAVNIESLVMDDPIWAQGPWTPLPSLEGNMTADVCVVGLGGSGLAAMAELAGRGADVVGIDAGSVGSGAAGRNGGFLLAGLADFFHRSAANFGGEIASGIYRHTLDEISHMAVEHAADVYRTGSLRIAATAEEAGDCEEHLRALQAHGFPAERYGGPEGAGLLIPTDATFHPLRCVRAQAARLVQGGARLFENSPALMITPGLVATPGGSIACDIVIAAIDGGLERVFPELASRVRTARLQMLATAPTHDVHFPRPVYWRYGYEYWQQLPGGEIALGGFRDWGGETEWTTKAVPGEVVQRLLEDFLRTHVGTSAPVIHRWAGCVAYTVDCLPVLEQVRDRVYVVGAYSGTGNIVGRLCGRAAARRAGGLASDWAELLDRAARARRG